ncbi:MAG: DNA polymerase III subunit gamma/tau [Thermodesulfobacteriota bacterium]|nr:DNA polymerase III subunit gamma/tau [Thermodesulfobacteriota bacterium]
MSYLVLARKWRPQIFADLVGQEHVSRTLANAITSGRVHHAFLFTGARGVGKTSAARILAKALNCEQESATEPCNVCRSCTEITAGQSVDVFEIDGASNNGVEDMRELRDTLRYLPAQSRYKIFIIDEVHMLSISAFNALLKTLEEPPEHVKFIFATTEPHKIPVTILSRCQRFDFRKISAIKVVAQLRRIVDAEKIEISDRSLALIAQRGGGSMRDCLSTLDQVVAFCSETVADEDVQGLLGMVDRRLLFDALEGCMQQNCSMVFEVIRRVDDLGHSFRQFCQELVEVVRQAILCDLVSNPQEELGLIGDELQALSRLCGLASQEDWQRLLSMLIKIEVELVGSVYPKLLVEMGLIRAASLPPGRDVAGLIQKIEALEGNYAGQPLPRRSAVAPRCEAPVAEMTSSSEVSAVASAPNSASSVSVEPGTPAIVEVESTYSPAVVPNLTKAEPEVVALAPAVAIEKEVLSDARGWLEFVQFVKIERPRIGSLLEHGSLLALELPLLRVGFTPESFMMQQLSDAETKERLNDIAKQFFGQDVQVKIESLSVKKEAPLSLVAAEEKRESDRGRRLRKDALSHPMVKKAVDVFSGEIEKITPIDKGFV